MSTLFIIVYNYHLSLDPEKETKECQCNGCKKKKIILQLNEPWRETKALFT